MKHKRKYHEISDDERNTSIEIGNIHDRRKRPRISLVPAINEINTDEEVWIVKLPGHLNPDQLHDKEVKYYFYFILYKNFCAVSPQSSSRKSPKT
jgi:hypothetical protein